MVNDREPEAGSRPAPAGTDKLRRLIEAFKAYSREQARTLGGLTFREMIDDGRCDDSEAYRPVPLRTAGTARVRFTPAGRLSPPTVPDAE